MSNQKFEQFLRALPKYFRKFITSANKSTLPNALTV